jgi:hypothetical protein
MRGALRCGGKCATFGRDDASFGWRREEQEDVLGDGEEDGFDVA